ncbi:hypothetical protein KY347_04880, partial [Candidatus Woesearchaeota archaeon]|nr:hypothetical protein [Candidatus Woesearchaeota archaeon]
AKKREEERKRREIEKKRQKELEEKRREEEAKIQKELKLKEGKRKESKAKKKKECRRKTEEGIIGKAGKQGERQFNAKTKKEMGLITAKEKKGMEEEKPEKKKLFGKFFGKKKDEVDLAKELEELRKVIPKAKKEQIKTKPKLPGLISHKAVESERKTAKSREIANAEEEIKNAIRGLKKAKKKKPALGRWFKKIEKPVEEKVEIPEIMPKAEGKLDKIDLIEEKIHKARLKLMDFNFIEAKRTYIEIMKIYNSLDQKKKLKVYQDIKDLYYERKSAEKFTR